MYFVISRYDKTNYSAVIALYLIDQIQHQNEIGPFTPVEVFNLCLNFLGQISVCFDLLDFLDQNFVKKIKKLKTIADLRLFLGQKWVCFDCLDFLDEKKFPKFVWFVSDSLQTVWLKFKQFDRFSSKIRAVWAIYLWAIYENSMTTIFGHFFQ